MPRDGVISLAPDNVQFVDIASLEDYGRIKHTATICPVQYSKERNYSGTSEKGIEIAALFHITLVIAIVWFGVVSGMYRSGIIHRQRHYSPVVSLLPLQL
jgi:hypothetical protein